MTPRILRALALATCCAVTFQIVARAETTDDATAAKMVSLAPHLTELAFAAGVGDRIVGTVEYSDYPAAAKAIPRIGDAFLVDYERLLTLAPQMVLAWDTGTSRSTIERIRELDLRVEVFSTQRIAHVARELRRIGVLTGANQTAEVAAAEFEARMAELTAKYRDRTPISVFIQINDSPLYTVNDQQIISEVVTLCGGKNVFGELSSLAPAIGEEAVIAVDPEVILSTDDSVAPAARWQRWKRMRAIRAGNVFRLRSDDLTRPTTRLADGTRSVCETLDRARNNRAQAATQ